MAGLRPMSGCTLGSNDNYWESARLFARPGKDGAEGVPVLSGGFAGLVVATAAGGVGCALLGVG
jgi:hypothetical protein